MSAEQPASESKIVPAYLRLPDAAVYCGLSEEMIMKLHRAGKGPSRIKKGRAVVYSVKALEAWMDRDEDTV